MRPIPALLLALICLLASAPAQAASALPPRCGVAPPSPAQVLESVAIVEAFDDQATGRSYPVVVPVAMHVVHAESGRGNVPNTMILEQIEVLNIAYEGKGFTFRLAGIDRTANDAWFRDFFGHESQIYSALAVDPATTLNLYISNIPYLGYAYLPGTWPEDSPWNAAVVLYSSLPDAGGAPYDEGDTAVHEVGHYLGLWHTFDGGCYGPGDGVDDTPAEASPAWDCPIGRDSCPQEGLDPIHNYMDYTDDRCLYRFTEGQRERMIALCHTHRPTLMETLCDLRLELPAYDLLLEPGAAATLPVRLHNECDNALYVDRADWSIAGPVRFESTIFQGAPTGFSPHAVYDMTWRMDVPAAAPEGRYTATLSISSAGEPISADSLHVEIRAAQPARADRY